MSSSDQPFAQEGHEMMGQRSRHMTFKEVACWRNLSDSSFPNSSEYERSSVFISGLHCTARERTSLAGLIRNARCLDFLKWGVSRGTLHPLVGDWYSHQ